MKNMKKCDNGMIFFFFHVDPKACRSGTVVETSVEGNQKKKKNVHYIE